jgi:UDP-N-acetylglucosamine 2-epimerase (non-hydrolysing)
MRICHVVGARPNFMKAAPVIRAISVFNSVDQFVVHTGQHYDFNMSDVFFQELGMSAPEFNLQVGSGSHAQQTAEIMSRFEPVVLQQKPDLVIVYGDVNSTLAAALVCSKLLVKVAHVEAGLRSFDRTMPEEINRVLTDQLADLLLTPSEDGDRNLAREGVDGKKIFQVGNVMIDTLIRMLPRATGSVLEGLPERFALVTLHRASNVDDLSWLSTMLETLEALSRELPIVFPMHPRTRERLSECSSVRTNGTLKLLDPLPYLSFLSLQQRAKLVITDSGGIQEETTFLGVPCLTVRENTERPVTVEKGTNILVGRDLARLQREIKLILAGTRKKGDIPPLWDGHAAERIAEVIVARS